jgi:hypothetical protein
MIQDKDLSQKPGGTLHETHAQRDASSAFVTGDSHLKDDCHLLYKHQFVDWKKPASRYISALSRC